MENYMQINSNISVSNFNKRRLHLLQSGELSDCEFEVSNEFIDGNGNESVVIIPCHKMILAASSEVFQRMFFGAFDNQDFTKISDVEPSHFCIFLIYIYTNILNIDNITLIEFNSLINLGKKYMIDDFVMGCISEIKQREWQLEDVIPIFEMACLYEIMPLLLHSYKEIKKNANELVGNHIFQTISTLYIKRFAVILSYHLDVTKIFNALENYAHKISSGSDDYKRIAEAACSLPFSKMPKPLFVQGPFNSPLLQGQRENILFNYI